MFGKVTVPVAKNALLPIVAASVMLDGESVVKSCPSLSDVHTSAEIINSLGSTAVFQNGNFSCFYSENENCEISEALCKKMRSSILYLAPLLYRKRKAVICYPGGCNLGKRQIDIHLDGLQRMGAKVECAGEKMVVTAAEGLKGVQYRLRLPSVGATQTLIMAAVTAKGITVLRNCAREPEIVDLARFLRQAGAKITGAGKGEIIIQGVSSLNAVEYTPIPDRIFIEKLSCGIYAHF